MSFDAIGREWDKLVESSARPALYLTHDWMAGWWRLRRHPKREQYVLLAKEGDRLAGIAPFVRVTRGVPPFGFRRLQFMTMERYAFSAKNISGSLEFIAGRGSEEPIEAMLSHVAANRADWDYLRLHPLPAGSESLTQMISWADRHGLPYAMRHVLSNAVIEVPPTWDEFTAGLSSNFRKSLRRTNNLLGKRGGVKIVEPAPGDDPERLFAEMADIDRRSWKQKRGIPLESIQSGPFYLEQMKRAARRGALMVWFMEADGRKVAYDMYIRHGSSAESLKSSYDAGFRRWSPGSYMLSHEIRAFQSMGITRVNLLWGDLPYKLKWTDKIEMGYEIYVCNNSPKGYLVHWGYLRSGLCRAVRFFSKLPERLRR